MAELKMIPVDAIDASAHNPRRILEEESLEGLAASIARLGVLQPILVMQGAKAGRYEIIAGERRWRASRIAHRTQIPALLLELDDPLLREAQIVENLEREQLNPIDEALALKSLQDRFGYTDSSLAQRLRRSVAFVRNRLELLRLHPDVQQYLIEEKITIGAALEITRIKVLDDQLEIAKEVEQKKLTSADTSARINKYNIEKRLTASRANKQQNLERKVHALAAEGIVITPSTYHPDMHHRIWDLVFPECAGCTLKATFLRSDGQVEDVCIEANCYNSLSAQQQEIRVQTQRSRQMERCRAFEQVLHSEDVTLAHLQYLLWSMLNLMGPIADSWRNDVGIELYSDTPTAASTAWNRISQWSYEQLLANIIHLSVAYITLLSNSNLPKGLKHSLIANFGLQPQLLDESSTV